jgi:hypothetical protein
MSTHSHEPIEPTGKAAPKRLPGRWWAAAAGVALIAGLAPGQAAQASPRTSAGNTIGGTVYDLQTGTPLSGICDQIMDVNNNYFVVGVQVSQADGTWQQQNLPDSTYTVEFFDCRASDYPFYFLGDTPLQDHATPVTLSGGVTNTSLQVHMPPGGGVTGTVTDAATHQPVNDMQVEIFYPQLVSGEQAYAGFTCTNSLGGWRIGGAPVTGVKVRFDGFGCGSETYSYQQAYYHQRATFNSAATVPVSANQDTTAINELVTPPNGSFGKVAGHVFDGVSGQPIGGICVSVIDPSTSATVATAAPSKTDGSYSMNYVPAGTPEIARFAECKVSPTKNHVMTWSGNTPYKSQATTFSVTARSTTTEDAMLPPGATITGTVRQFTSTGALYANVPVDVSYANGPAGMSDLATYTVCTGGSGQYTARALPAGSPPAANLKISVNVPGMPLQFAPGATTCADTGSSTLPWGWHKAASTFASADVIDLNAPGMTLHGVNVVATVVGP